MDLKGENEIASPQNWNVVRVDNVRRSILLSIASFRSYSFVYYSFLSFFFVQIPWDLEVRSVQAWLESSSIPQIPKTVQILSIHILCNR